MKKIKYLILSILLLISSSLLGLEDDLYTRPDSQFVLDVYSYCDSKCMDIEYIINDMNNSYGYDENSYKESEVIAIVNACKGKGLKPNDLNQN